MRVLINIDLQVAAQLAEELAGRACDAIGWHDAVDRGAGGVRSYTVLDETASTSAVQIT